MSVNRATIEVWAPVTADGVVLPEQVDAGEEIPLYQVSTSAICGLQLNRIYLGQSNLLTYRSTSWEFCKEPLNHWFADPHKAVQDCLSRMTAHLTALADGFRDETRPA